MEILYKKKVIRDFLSLYSESSWTQLVSHLLEYGIILFKKKYNVTALSPEDIFKIVENFKKEEHIYDKKNVKKIGMKNLSKNKNNSNESNDVSSRSKSRTNSISATKNKKFKSNFTHTYSDKNIFSTSKNKKNNTLKRAQTPNKNNNNFKNTLMSKKKNNNTLKRINSNLSFKSNKSRTNSKKKNIKRNNLTNYSRTSTISNDSFINYTNEKKFDLPLQKNKKSEIKTVTLNKNNNNLYQKTKLNEIKNLDDKLIHYNNEKNNGNLQHGTQKVTAESKIKALIDRDRKKHLEEMKLMKLNNNTNNKFTFDENSNNNVNINNEIISNNINNNFKENILNENFNENLGNKNFGMSLDNNNNFSFTKTKIIENNNLENNSNNLNKYGEKFSLNDAPIISIEDKINGLTQKLSKLNSSFNKTREILSGYNNDNILNKNLTINPNNNNIPYFKNDFLNKSNFTNPNNNIYDKPLNIIPQNEIIHSNILSTNNNDEDYIGEDQIDLSQNPNSNLNSKTFENK